MKLNLYNTLTKQVEEFISIEPMKVKMYTCGPTVYNFAHIGNLRTYIFEDTLKRVLQYNNYEVKHVMNITDVGHLQSDADDGEDKMELGAKRESKSVLEIARFYEDAFINDLEKLNIILPNEIPRATEHIKSIINLIKTLEEKGYTYIANNNVYFSIDKFDNYSKLANLSIQELQAGNRVEVDEFKKNPLDFVLWFGNSKYENHILKWDSPWGVGFPGWHIECSAMAIEYLGEYLDIHCGGIDHVPVHHTNEIAQSEGALGHKWVNYWMHGEFLVVDNGKMSKSSGDFLTLNKLIENKFDPLVYRYYVLQSKYRKPLAFSYERLEEASKSFLSLKSKIQTILDNIDENSKINESMLKNYIYKFKNQINDDLNISNGFTVLFDVIKDNNSNNLEKKTLIDNFDLVFGLNLVSSNNLNLSQEKINWIENLLKERSEYRKNKNWKKSDEIRDILLKENIEILDTKEGTKWNIL
ncbi:cysteine--tRNA ligase CysS [[Clostridium] sordellii]|uniref:Cysteine--tRNA ligase n=1 Tax=Paraclostridium sordellii TaxID=1505 RepID=A0ABM9RQM7_PARSO|nr:cysteine--tRNA ligase [Paeniclostridium sordellii]CEJ74100.1 cysteinyl-tRNA synthetase [[Clostridium] sordellii] [Paeniclostridium sordellii]CEN69645.1 cysteine--tRNA ligase CysS [[Clostridium] sordellii] [Paeniclostridium sordellii]CEN72913.1 cysteine--tRNA ligase CysS [[Clostridium] sordellii] [Paeniclostridium sordellii]CEO25214.1 cysteine--tRNA ligase CysS [[Clostridium] sordellii] [Paeniclostridium sordellii]CEP75494.1 cysteine--tRNA ligase CysS [[Clostridium] sordellii] [Paeniclostrid